MKKHLQLFLAILVFGSLFFATQNSRISASSDFNTGYNITYTVNESGMTHVVMIGTLTNKLSRIYATSETLTLDYIHLENIQAYDALGKIKYKLTTDANHTIISLPFNVKAAGLNKQMQFTLMFDTPEIAQHAGNIWEMNMPAIANQKNLSDLTVNVNVPADFGPPSIVKPEITSNNLTFDKNILGSSGISISFGTKQAYDFNLTYHLKNTNVFPIKTEVALPPTTNYQNVVLNSINPKPQDVTLDSDGNWIAQYYLLPSQKINVQADVSVYVSQNPKPQTLSPSQRSQDLQPQQYWETNNFFIKQKASQLKTPQAIYDFVVHTLHYDFNRINKKLPRLGAASVLQNPQSAVCLEFTDLFIALSRSAGIPAREIDGYAYTQNPKQRPLSYVKDILHAWPEYYDDQRQTWVMVDPTWGNTTHGIDYFHQMDFDHVAFVIKGASSTYPIPAGVYKTADDLNKKDIIMHFVKNEDLPLEQFSFTPVTYTKYFAGLPMGLQIKVTNSGKIMTSPQQFIVKSGFLSPSSQIVTLPPVPPLGSTSQDVSFNAVPFLTNRTYPFTILLASRQITGYIVAAPFVLTKEIILGGFFVVLLAIVIFIIAREARRLHVP